MWQLGKIRRAIQLEIFGVYSNVSSFTLPSATSSRRSTECPFTISSTGTVRESPIRAPLEMPIGLLIETNVLDELAVVAFGLLGQISGGVDFEVEFLT